MFSIAFAAEQCISRTRETVDLMHLLDFGVRHLQQIDALVASSLHVNLAVTGP